MSHAIPVSLPHSFEQLVEEHQSWVYRICRSILRDEHLGADAAQETFVRLWRRLSEESLPDHFVAWLRRVAVNTSLDLARRRRVQSDATESVLSDSTASDVTEDRGPAARAAATELDHRLEQALTRLSEGQRTVFLLRHSGGLSLAEVAEVLSVSLPTVKTQFARACLRLSTYLAPFRPEEESTS